MKSWKTALAGIATILTGIASIFNGGDQTVATANIITGVGLLLAKDGDVTGGTRQQ